MSIRRTFFSYKRETVQYPVCPRQHQYIMIVNRVSISSCVRGARSIHRKARPTIFLVGSVGWNGEAEISYSLSVTVILSNISPHKRDDGGFPAFIAAWEIVAAVNMVLARLRTDLGNSATCSPPAESIS
ncbi:hypothetical protein MDV089.5 [Gallid alphaherpesvirus 2]|nr:hypothetical protein MDV089.5 [Gallid alphaherpesvirus 2]